MGLSGTKVLKFLFILLLIDKSSTKFQTAEDVIICYYDSKAYWRTALGRFQAQDIEPSLCTHLIYSFIGLKESSSKLYSTDPGLDFGPGELELEPDDSTNFQGDLDMIRKTVKLRAENPELKILISVGGPGQQALSSFSLMAQDPGRRAVFVESVLDYITKFELDGVDLYWMAPKLEERQSFVQVLKELKEALIILSRSTGKSYLLTAAFACRKELIEQGYDVQEISKHLDYFNLFCVDFKSYSNESEASQRIGHHAPLYSKTEESLDDQQLTVGFGINLFLELGAPSHKIVLGIAPYGRTYSLQSAQLNNFYDLAKGSGAKGEFTESEGFLAYFEICDMIKRTPTGWVFRYDYTYRVPYVSNNQIWIGYENEISAKEKVDFVLAKALGGLMIKFIDLDDSTKICGAWTRFPITAAESFYCFDPDQKRLEKVETSKNIIAEKPCCFQLVVL